MSNGVKQCGKCGYVYEEDDCPRCTYGIDDEREAADFRAFRREIVLAMITGIGDSYDGPESSAIYDASIWQIATRIARAEPKGGE